MECVRGLFPRSRLQEDCELVRWPEWAQVVVRSIADHRHLAVGRETFALTDRLRQSEAIQDAFTKLATKIIGTCTAPYNPGMELGDSQYHELVNLKAASVLQQGIRK